ncbi:D-arabinono-1,4-lactone oxidase [Kockovaella imperatae]|uniref:D-arabinono-1,4-lactone oxidase n=1 Tax=Kockovaella imperatae TaxID=4999 RepID=A0A1Y1UGP7_9TREE|nr:D-arabinono-1,4-lactone oxidase [Kockovaella imperatae]ORX37208.1 D-arabinono-1,4-lactone oxidase [Kockovaella imperatae]
MGVATTDEMDLLEISDKDLHIALAAITIEASSSASHFSNWARTFHCHPERVLVPHNILQCRQILELARREGKSVHPVGVGHSPSDLACTNGWLVKMGGLKGAVRIDAKKQTAVFRAGTVLHDVHAILSKSEPPLAVPNIGSISDQTIGGLISTASHGSGVNYPVLSKHARSITMALPLPGAPVVKVSADEDPALFKASLCGLGATGMMLEVEIEVEPAFRLKEVKTPHTVDHFFAHFDSIRRSAEHVRAWWYPDGQGIVVGRANRTYEPARPASSVLDFILGYHVTQFFLLIARFLPFLTPWVGRWAWWLSKGESVVVDDGYKVLNFDCLFPQYALEWAVPSENAVQCMSELRSWLQEEAERRNGIRVHFPIEIRWSCADDIWLSPSVDRDTTWIGVVTYRPYGLPVPYRQFQKRFSSICADHGGRPHWAKQHSLEPKSIENLYPNFSQYLQVLNRVDPQGILRSEYVKRHIEGVPISGRMFKKRS